MFINTNQFDTQITLAEWAKLLGKENLSDRLFVVEKNPLATVIIMYIKPCNTILRNWASEKEIEKYFSIDMYYKNLESAKENINSNFDKLKSLIDNYSYEQFYNFLVQNPDAVVNMYNFFELFIKHLDSENNKECVAFAKTCILLIPYNNLKLYVPANRQTMDVVKIPSSEYIEDTLDNNFTPSMCLKDMPFELGEFLYDFIKYNKMKFVEYPKHILSLIGVVVNIFQEIIYPDDYDHRYANPYIRKLEELCSYSFLMDIIFPFGFEKSKVYEKSTERCSIQTAESNLEKQKSI